MQRKLLLLGLGGAAVAALLVATSPLGARLGQSIMSEGDPADCGIITTFHRGGEPGSWRYVAREVAGEAPAVEGLRYAFRPLHENQSAPEGGTLTGARGGDVAWIDRGVAGRLDEGDELRTSHPEGYTLEIRDASGALVGGTIGCV